MTIILKISSLKSDEMGKQLMHIFMVLDKKMAQGASALVNFNKILSFERAMLKKIQIFCDVTPWQVVNSTNISGEHSSSIFRVEESNILVNTFVYISFLNGW